MGKIHKIPMYNVCTADVIFRIKGILYNEGRIIVDRDSLEFAGHMADDIIIGRNVNELFRVDYHYNSTSFGYNDFVILVKMNITDASEFQDKVIKSDKGYELEFKKIEFKNRKMIESAIAANKDLIEIKE